MSLGKLKTKQIQSLDSNQIPYQQIFPDTFEIPVHLPLGTLFISLALPPQFPNDPPVISVKPAGILVLI